MPVVLNLSVLTVALIYYMWRDGYLQQMRRQRVLRERVAYMLWVAANNVH